MLPIMRNSYWLPELFNDLMNAGTAAVRQSHTAPATNVWEDNTGYTVEMAAPGLRKEDCVVKIDDEGNLQVTMEHKHDEKSDNESCRYLRREFSYAKYSQRLLLPDDVDKSKISARVEDGILTVILPKLETVVQNVGRQIDIQ